MYADLAADTRARAGDVPGRYYLTLPNHWDYLLPSGGVVMTCALRAAVVHLADANLRLVSATIIFADSMASATMDCFRRPRSIEPKRVR